MSKVPGRGEYGGKPVDFVICAAGEGARLRRFSQGLPKPLLLLQGRTLLEIALDSLDVESGDGLIIVAQRKHALRARLEDAVRRRYVRHEVQWLELDHPTGGQLESALAARQVLDDVHGVAIFNSDTYFRSSALGGAMRVNPPPGLILVHRVDDETQTQYSFCRAQGPQAGSDSGSQRVVEVAEKRRIAPWASVGLYFFRDKRAFLHYADAEMVAPFAASGLKEKYVIPVYAHMIRDGLEVRMVECETFRPMGTPEDLQTHWGMDLKLSVKGN